MPNDNDSLLAEGDQPYLMNDGVTSSPSFDGSVPNNIANIDPTSDISTSLSNTDTPNLGVSSGGIPSSNASTGDASDHVDPSVDGVPKETDGLVPDGSITNKIKKPRRSEEIVFDLLHVELRHKHAKCRKVDAYS